MKRFLNLTVSLVAVAILGILAAAPATCQAASYDRVVVANTQGATLTNALPFYNAKILAVRAVNLVPTTGSGTNTVAVTNTITVSEVTADGMTNSLASFSTTSNTSTNLETYDFLWLKGDKLIVTATTNATVEVVADNRGR